MVKRFGQGGGCGQDGEDLAGRMAFQFPESGWASRGSKRGGVQGGVVGVACCQQAQMTRSQARATMRVACGLRLPRVRAWAYRRPAQGEANRELCAKAVRALPARRLAAQRN
jgi:hypothetical protein